MNLFQKISALFKKEISVQFISYAFVGAIATAVDWGSFYVVNLKLGINYKIAVSVSFILGATTNYLINKTLTFKDPTKQILPQVSVYTGVSLISLFFSILLMHLWVDILNIFPMYSRIITTGVMLFINFVLHKFITFNQKLYK